MISRIRDSLKWPTLAQMQTAKCCTIVRTVLLLPSNQTNTYTNPTLTSLGYTREVDQSLDNSKWSLDRYSRSQCFSTTSHKRESFPGRRALKHLQSRITSHHKYLESPSEIQPLEQELCSMTMGCQPPKGRNHSNYDPRLEKSKQNKQNGCSWLQEAYDFSVLL